MLRRRGLAWAAALALVLSLSVAPTVRAADATITGPGHLWTTVHTWIQDLLVGWTGWGTGVENNAPISTYDASDGFGDPAPSGDSPDGGKGDFSTTNTGADPDPDG